MSKSIRTIVVVSIVILVCLGMMIVETQTEVLRRTIDNFIYDNENHYLPCAKLPTEAEVIAIVQQHQDIIQAIEQVNPGLVGVDIETSTCPGKADLVIWYASHQNRLSIKAILDDDTLFGVPYRMQNR